jgi:hypothetical protein
LTEERLLASNPRDANYQNLPLADEDLPAFLLEFFPEKASRATKTDSFGARWRDETVAVATDTNFVFQPITRDGFVFLQRRFQRIADRPAEIPRIQKGH